MKMSAKFDYPEPIMNPEAILSREYRQNILTILVKKMTHPAEMEWIPGFKAIFRNEDVTNMRSVMSFASESSTGAWPYELVDFTNPEAMVTPPSWFAKYTEIRRRQMAIGFECVKLIQMVPDPFTMAVYEPKIRTMITEVKDMQASMMKILEEHASVAVTEMTIITHITYHVKLQAVLLEHQTMVYFVCMAGMTMMNGDHKNIVMELMSGVNRNILILTEEAKKTTNLERYKLLTTLPKDDQEIYTTLLEKQIILLEIMKKVTEITVAPEDPSRYMPLEKIMETIKMCESAILEVLTAYKYTERVTTIKVQDVLLNMQLTIAHIKFFILQPIMVTVNRNMATRDEFTNFIINAPASLRSVQVLAWKVQVSLQIARYIQEQKNVMYIPEIQMVYDKLHEVMIMQIMVDQEIEGLTLFTHPEMAKPDVIPTLVKNVEAIKKCQGDIKAIVSTVPKANVPRLWMKIEEVVNYHIRILRTAKMLLPIIFMTVEEPEMVKSYKEMFNMVEQLMETAHGLKIIPKPGMEIRLPGPTIAEPMELPQPHPIVPTHPDITPRIVHIVNMQRKITSRLRALRAKVPRKEMSVAAAESSITRVLSDIGKTQQEMDSICSVLGTMKDAPIFKSIAGKITEIMEKHKNDISMAKTLVDTLVQEKVIPAMSPIMAKIADIQAQMEPLIVKLGNIMPPMMNRIPSMGQGDGPLSGTAMPPMHALSVNGEIHCEFGNEGIPPKTITIKVI